MATDTDTALDLYLTGLRNAHALEHEAMGIMQRQIERLENYADVKRKLQSHLKETETQAERLEAILEEFDSTPSSVKDMGAHVMGTIASLAHAATSDEILKNTFANYAFENFEIASYKSLIALADATQQSPHVRLLEQSLGEEIAMASWIENNTRKGNAQIFVVVGGRKNRESLISSRRIAGPLHICRAQSSLG